MLIHGMDVPDTPEDNRSATAPTKFRWWRVLLGVFLLGILLMGFVPCMPSRREESKNRSEALSKSRMIHGVMSDFIMKYGRFPGPETIEEVRKSTGTTIALGTASSNDYLRQLIAAGADEKIFHSGSKKFRRPDERVDGKHALEKGECGFAYVVGVEMSDDPFMPLLIGPVIPGEKRFDSKAFDKKAVVLRLDGSAISLTINIHGHIALGGGKSIDPA